MIHEMTRATDDMLQTATSNLEEISDVLKRLKKVRAQVKDFKSLEDQGKLKECNAGAGIICTGSHGLLMAMFAREVVGNNPAAHLQHHMDIAIKSLKECYGNDTGGEVPDESGKASK